MRAVAEVTKRPSAESAGERDDRHEQNSAYSPDTARSLLRGASSSIGRALDCGSSGYGFEPREAPQVPVTSRDFSFGSMHQCRRATGRFSRY